MATAMPQRRTNRSMSGSQLLHKVSKSRQWKFLVKNGRSMRGIFGETDDAKRTISINKKLHKVKSGGHLQKNADGTESLIGTIDHELIHAAHPKMHEKTVRKVAKKQVKRLSTKTKQRAYARFRK